MSKPRGETVFLSLSIQHGQSILEGLNADHQVVEQFAVGTSGLLVDDEKPPQIIGNEGLEC